jgi:hypothetical protein
MKHKKLFISIISIASVFIFFAVFLLIWFFGDTYKDFETFKQTSEIPGLDDGAVPQGLGNYTTTYETEDGKSEKQQYFFVSAYMVDGSASRVYVTGEKTGYVGYVTMKDTDGETFYGHCGGIAVASNGATMWIASDDMVYVAKTTVADYTNIGAELIARAAMTNAEDKVITFTKKFNANCNAAFCFYYDDPTTTSASSDRLYVGEFYRKGNYETAESHRVTTPNDYSNTAFAYEYNVSTSSEYGLTTLSSSENLSSENRVPAIKKIISLPEKIQGFALTYDSGSTKLVLSQSYGLANSHILVYDWSKVTDTSNRVTFKSLGFGNFSYSGITTNNGNNYTVTDLNVYFVDNNNDEIFLNDYSIPSMSEGLCANGNKAYVLFESAGKKYNKFVRQQTKNIYSIVPKQK